MIELQPCKGGDIPHCCGEHHRFTLPAREAQAHLDKDLRTGLNVHTNFTVYECGAVRFLIEQPTPDFCRSFGVRLDELENTEQFIWAGNIVPGGKALHGFEKFWKKLIVTPGMWVRMEPMTPKKMDAETKTLLLKRAK